jgi:hypothetical protein
MYSLSQGCVTRQGVVITDLKSLLDYQLNFSRARALSLPLPQKYVQDANKKAEKGFS